MLRVSGMSLVAGALLATLCFAQAPSSAPAGSNGLCKDGTYWTGATKKGACRGHKGVQAWYGAAAAPDSTKVATTSVAPAAAPSMKAAAPAPAAVAAPGGGAGKVWVNSSTKVYHCPSDRWYGKTKSGAYMSESDAVAQGDRPDHGKACSK